jgi:phospho-N-acetylmuramoyl-pentapeptide-transferase
MLLILAELLQPYLTAFRVVDYVTFRAIMATITALALALAAGPRLIRYLVRLKAGQTVRLDGPETHLKKNGTPTMGGLLILGSMTITTLLWADLSNAYIWILLAVLLSTASLGFYDDYIKAFKKNSGGVSSRFKMVVLSAIAIATGLFLYHVAQLPEATFFWVPFFKNINYPLGAIGFTCLTYLVIVGTSNAVNLTDGLDGLASLPITLVAAGLMVFAYVSGHAIFAKYLHLPFIPGVHEVVIFCAAMCGACLGFLWFNSHPAQVFMGDVGSLSLGAALGTVAVIVRQEIVLVIMGGLFVAEAISVILQVGSFKLRKKRIFRMAPLHHHFEKGGWQETQVVIRFWIIAIVLVLIGLSTIKLR